ncbi:hypothetical protein Q9233_009249 [Columba guinea]|nr:hypothetical protein Q9233_009249 [Columba guinea]
MPSSRAVLPARTPAIRPDPPGRTRHRQASRVIKVIPSMDGKMHLRLQDQCMQMGRKTQPQKGMCQEKLRGEWVCCFGQSGIETDLLPWRPKGSRVRLDQGTDDTECPLLRFQCGKEESPVTLVRPSDAFQLLPLRFSNHIELSLPQQKLT